MTQTVKLTTKNLKNEKIRELLELINIDDKYINKLNDVEKELIDLKTIYKNKEIDAEQYLKKISKLIDDSKSFGIKIESDERGKFIAALYLKKNETVVEDKAVIGVTKNTVKSANNILYAITWTERERGWGQRPDGITVHTSIEEGKRFVQDYINKQPKEVPEEYSAPDFREPKLVEVSDSLVQAIKSYGKSENTLWLTVNDLSSLKTFDAKSCFAPVSKKKIKP